MRYFIMILLCMAVLVTGCGRKDSSKTEIVFWTTDSESDRVAVQTEIAKKFMAENPDITVLVVPVQESELPKKIVAAKVAKKLPDVMRLGLEYVFGYAGQGIVDTSDATTVSLGRPTASSAASKAIQRATRKRS